MRLHEGPLRKHRVISDLLHGTHAAMPFHVVAEVLTDTGFLLATVQMLPYSLCRLLYWDAKAGSYEPILWHGHLKGTCLVTSMVQQEGDAHCTLAGAGKGLPLRSGCTPTAVVLQ